MITLPITATPEDLARAYGCFANQASSWKHRSTYLSRYARDLGPIRVYYSRQRGTWTLDQKPIDARSLDILAKQHHHRKVMAERRG